MSAFLLHLILLFCPRTRISAHASTNPEFTEHVATVAPIERVPELLLMAVGIHESGLGSNTHTPYPWGVMPATMRAYCARTETSCTGDRLHDQIAASAHVLRVGRDACGSWEGSLRRYYSGACWATRPRITRADARVRARRSQFYRRLRAYMRAVSYSTRVLHSAELLRAHARRENADMAASMLSFHATR